MAQTEISAQGAPGFWSTTGLALTFTAADVANGNKTAGTNDLVIVAKNTGASPHTVTITSVALDDYSRTGDVAAQSLAASEIRIFRLTKNGWADSNGDFLYAADHAEIEFAAVDLKQAT